MQLRSSNESPTFVSAGALIVPVFSDQTLDGPVAEVDTALHGAIARVFAEKEITGKKGQTALFRSDNLKCSRIYVNGLGDRAKLEPKALAKWAGAAVRHLGKRGVTEFAFIVPPEVTDVEAAAAFIIEGAMAATLDATLYRSEQEDLITLNAVTLIGKDKAALDRGAERGAILGAAINSARVWALTPANDMTPTILSERAREVAQAPGLSIDVLDEAKMKELGMNSLLGVSQGSAQPATLMVISYKGDPDSKDVLALVGKAITFDTGGISIKPATSMHEMKYDMCGGAGVIASMGAIAALKPKINVIGVVPSSENMPSSTATKPGDIHKAMSGKTIEVINTDAEGRLILADALHYAKTLGATRIIDCATLTGACVIALGHAASAAVTNDDDFLKGFLAVANLTGERYWHMPLYDDYKEDVKSSIADLRNASGREAGTLTAAAFLQAFVGDTPWIHLDIAGTAYTDDNGAGMAKGPTGTPVRALVQYVLSQSK
jgi:leucyl aminopeptidase